MSEKNNFINLVDKDVEKLESLQSQVFENSLILTNILKYSNVSGLKTARTVSKFWNEMANPFLKHWTKFTFSIQQNDNNSTFCHHDIPLKIRAFENLKLQNLKFISNENITIPEFEDTINKPTVETFFNLFQKCNPQITNIDLNLKSENESSKLIIQSLLKECKNINKITLAMEISTFFQNEPQPKTSAKILEICCIQENYKDLLKIFPALQELQLGSIVSYNFLHLPWSNSVYKELLKNLKILRIKGLFYGYLEERHLALLPIELEELEFSNWRPTPINHCLWRFNNSLVKFRAKISVFESSLYFPKMNKLETLLFSCYRHKNIDSWEFKWELVEATFPKLKRLEVVCCEDGENFMNSFLAEENRKQFPNLETAILSVWEYDENNFKKIKRLEKNFGIWGN